MGLTLLGKLTIAVLISLVVFLVSSLVIGCMYGEHLDQIFPFSGHIAFLALVDGSVGGSIMAIASFSIVMGFMRYKR